MHHYDILVTYMTDFIIYWFQILRYEVNCDYNQFVYIVFHYLFCAIDYIHVYCCNISLCWTKFKCPAMGYGLKVNLYFVLVLLNNDDDKSIDDVNDMIIIATGWNIGKYMLVYD